MIMQTVNLFDLIIVDKVQRGIRISTNCKYIPTNEKNIAYKAALLFFEKSGEFGGVRGFSRALQTDHHDDRGRFG